jgi:hypothetical protein
MQSIAGGSSNLASSAIAKGGAGLGAKVPVSEVNPASALDQFNSTKGSIDLSGIGTKATISEPYFGANSGNLYGYKGGNFLKTNKKL